MEEAAKLKEAIQDMMDSSEFQKMMEQHREAHQQALKHHDENDDVDYDDDDEDE